MTLGAYLQRREVMKSRHSRSDALLRRAQRLVANTAYELHAILHRLDHCGDLRKHRDELVRTLRPLCAAVDSVIAHEHLQRELNLIIE
jgi:hypothetical protein